MKKGLIVMIALLLALGSAFSGVSRVQAASPHSLISVMDTPPDPYATPASADSGMTTTILGQPVLPGTTELSSGKFIPLGFTNEFAQYGGPGLKISGLVYPATATVCFPFRDYNFKWTGKVYKWDETNSAWAALVTSFPEDADGVSNWACASGAGSGIYSLITWYYGPPEPPVDSAQARCKEVGGLWIRGECWMPE